MQELWNRIIAKNLSTIDSSLHVMQNINCTNVNIFAWCLTIGKWPLWRILCAWIVRGQAIFLKTVPLSRDVKNVESHIIRWCTSPPPPPPPKAWRGKVECENPSKEVVSTHVSRLQNCSRFYSWPAGLKLWVLTAQQLRLELCYDSTSSTLFIMERLAQHLRLARHNHSVKISGIGATSNQPSSRGVTNFGIVRPDDKGKIVLTGWSTDTIEDYV